MIINLCTAYADEATNGTMSDDVSEITFEESENNSEFSFGDVKDEKIIKLLEQISYDAKYFHKTPTYSNYMEIYLTIPEKEFKAYGSTTEESFDRPMSLSFEFDENYCKINNKPYELSESQNYAICNGLSQLIVLVDNKNPEQITQEEWEQNKNNPNPDYTCSFTYGIKDKPENRLFFEQSGKYVHISEVKIPYTDLIIPEQFLKINVPSYVSTNSNEWNNILYNALFKTTKLFDYVLPDTIIKLQNVDLENYTHEGKPIDIVERLTFDITVPSHEYCEPLYEVSNPGGQISCKIEQLGMNPPERTSHKYYYVLTMSGNKSKVTLFSEAATTTNFFTDLKLYFNNQNRYTDNQFVAILDNEGLFSIDGCSGDYEMKSVYFSSHSVEYGGFLKEIEAYNVKYEFFKENFGYNYNRNLYAKFHPDFFTVHKDLVNEKYKENSGGNFDLKRYVNFIAQNELKLSPNEKPEWFANLGGGVNATVLGIKRVVNGKEKDTDIMLQLKGSSKTRWFTMERATPSDNLANDSTLSKGDLHYDIVMTAVKSFDGVNVEYYSDNANAHKIGLNILFDYQDGEVLYNGMEFVFDDAVKTVSPENQKYIGGGKSIYDNLFTPLELPQE